jgi:hypothetical protein
MVGVRSVSRLNLGSSRARRSVFILRALNAADFACYTQRSVGFPEQYSMGFKYAPSGTEGPPTTLFEKNVYAGVENWWEALYYDDIARKPPHVVYLDYYL